VSKKLISIAVTAFAVTACGSSPSPTPGGEPSAAQRTARIALIRDNPKLNDLDLAHLCPALYPADVLKNPKKYSLDKLKATAKFTPAQLAQATAAGCGSPVPLSAAAPPAKK
jgi:hypothetical protein